jgi:hypothetical protein
MTHSKWRLFLISALFDYSSVAFIKLSVQNGSLKEIWFGNIDG